MFLACLPSVALGSTVEVHTFRDNSEECRDIGTCEIMHDVFFNAAKARPTS